MVVVVVVWNADEGGQRAAKGMLKKGWNLLPAWLDSAFNSSVFRGVPGCQKRAMSRVRIASAGS